MSEDDLIQCSFCGCSTRERKHIISGSGGNICDKCVLACVEILMGMNDTECNPESAPVQGEDAEPDSQE